MNEWKNDPKLQIRINCLSAQDYLFLRNDVGWGEAEITDVEGALAKSLIVISLYWDDSIAGSIRIVGDGKLCFYIQDLMIAKAHQKKGWGSLLFEQALEYIGKNAAHNAFVGLMAAKGVENLYKKYQFIARPNEAFGPGMIRFWGREGETSEV